MEVLIKGLCLSVCFRPNVLLTSPKGGPESYFDIFFLLNKRQIDFECIGHVLLSDLLCTEFSMEDTVLGQIFIYLWHLDVDEGDCFRKTQWWIYPENVFCVAGVESAKR